MTAMAEERDINNLIILKSEDAEKRASAFTALESLVRENWDHVQVENEAINFNTEWEPPYKELKAFSKEHPDVELLLLADAFANRHWICKSTIAAGKSDDLVLSRIDDDFDKVFEEIYGKSLVAWESAPSEPFGKLLAK